MVKSFSLAAIGSVSAKQHCVDSWCDVTRNVVALQNSPSDKVSFEDCHNMCLLNDENECQGFSLTPVDSAQGTCTHYRIDDEQGAPKSVFTYFPVVNVTKVLPPAGYTIKQVGQPTTVTGLDQCRDMLRASSAHAVFANYGNEACGTKATHNASVIDGQYVESEVVVNMRYNSKTVGLGSAQASGFLTLTSHGLALRSSPGKGSDWTWSLGGVRLVSNGWPVCFSSLNETLTPVYVDQSRKSSCAMGQRGGSPNGASRYGWVMRDYTQGDYKCMGDVTPKGKYDLIAIEKPVKGLCNTKWKVTPKNIVSASHSALTSRKCEEGALDGAWVDAQLYPTGDFSPEWFDTLTISSSDKKLHAHTKGADATVDFSIKINSCSITVFLRDGCDDCIATGTLSESGDSINWDSGFNDGDSWIRKNHGCCTLFDAKLKTPSSDAHDAVSRVPRHSSSAEDLKCAAKFAEGRWVDRSKGDFAFSWVPYMELSSEPLKDETDANGRMTAPVEQGSWVLPVNFFADGKVCKMKLCLERPCGGEGYSIGSLVHVDEIHWDERLDHGKWERQKPSDVCQEADSKYSCCDMKGSVGCVFAPSVEVCNAHQGEFCCDPDDPYAQCGFEPSVTPTMV